MIVLLDCFLELTAAAVRGVDDRFENCGACSEEGDAVE
jgi:hypothetical protein